MYRPPLSQVVGRVVDLFLVILVLGLTVRLFTEDDEASSAQAADVVSERVSTWTALVSAAIPPHTSAEVQVITFVDYQCPTCRQLHLVLDSLMRTFPGRLSVGVIPFPLRGHQHAVKAANATQCAFEQGRLDEFEDVVYSNQRSIGKIPMELLAERAGVPELAEFKRCIAAGDTLPSVRRGLELASALGLPGTPSIVVNGMLLTRIRSAEAFAEHLTAILTVQPTP